MELWHDEGVNGAAGGGRGRKGKSKKGTSKKYRHLSPGRAGVDTSFLSEHSLSAIFRAAGSVTRAIDDVLGTPNANSSNPLAPRHTFCLIRPPGHHCGRDGVEPLDTGMDLAQGFCFLNNVMTTKTLREPGTGAPLPPTNPHHIHILNIPLPPNTTHKPFMQAFRKQILPAMEEFKPDLVLCSAGFDGFAGDIGGWELSEETYLEIGRGVRGVGEGSVSVLEGGYLGEDGGEGLGRCVEGFLRGVGGL
ncbi:hypothetical protein HDV00_011753 [Rhizophlyctis rosea]|nr:hypothetical protein HDV00_011753 [Rhizophlyctis rosea]